MDQLVGYALGDLVSEGRATVIYRGRRDVDGARVAVKALRAERPDLVDLAALRHEYTILRGLDVPGVAKAHAIVPYRNGLALIMEDLGGRPLGEVLRAERLDPASVLRLGARLAEILEGVHRREVIHKDINPQNILVGPDLEDVRLVDFGIATTLSRETQRAVAPDALEGTLAYMSPEQTGRMNRVIDRRSDLYSLGVTLYEAATGTLPFAAADPLTLIHSHIARVPSSPHERAPEIPRAVSDIIMKLLSKDAEDRYQSARGLREDLLECSRRLRSVSIDPFRLGARDRSGELNLPQRLYGRAAEIAELSSAFERVSRGEVELVLLTGPSGAGKSSLAREIEKTVAARGGRLASGKFDPLARTAPCSAVAGAFRDLVRLRLTERAPALARLREAILGAASGQGQILIDLIPELELLIGPQPAVAALGPNESQNRFALVLQSVARVFASREHPLALFLDDLQWADPASLRLLQILLGDPDAGYLLVIGAYRDNEVDAAHPLTSTIAALREGGLGPRTIALGPLALPAITELFADALGEHVDRVGPLSELAARKTHGNPFFLGQFLLSLHRSGLVSFHEGAGSFEWDIGRVEGANITDNVVDLLAEKIDRLSPGARRVIEIAACIGHQFDIDALAAALGGPPDEVAKGLREVVREGLIVPVGAPARGAAYRFSHDRLRQAAHARVEDRERPEVHLRVGRHLRAAAGEDPGGETIFEAIRHLTLGAARIEDPIERADLARLHLAVGRRAKARTAHREAAGYFAAGMALLAGEDLSQDHDFVFALHAERAECEYMSGAFDVAETLFGAALARASTNLERARIHLLRTVLYQTMAKFADAVRAGAEGLALFGVVLPEAAEAQAALGAELGSAAVNLGGRPIESLIDAPPLRDPEQAIILELLRALAGPLFILMPAVFPVAAVKAVNISLEHGHSAVSSFSYASYGFMLAVFMGRDAEAYAFGQLALGLNARLENEALRCMLNVGIAVHLHHYKPLRSALPYLEEARRAGVASGDFSYLSYACYQTFMIRMGMGDELDAIQREVDAFLVVMRRTKDAMSTACLKLGRQILASLTGGTRALGELGDDGFDEAAFLAGVEGAGLTFVSFWYYTAKLTLRVHCGDYQGALEMAAEAERRLGGALGNFIATELPFYTCLALTGLRAQAAPGGEPGPPAELARHAEELARLAERCPSNHLHKYLLVCAESAGVAGKDVEAMDLYDQAIAEARRSGATHHEALANELAAKYYLARGRGKIARAYLADAHYGYLRWGASAKAAELAARYPAMHLGRPEAGGDLGPDSDAPETKATRRIDAARIDAATVLRAAQAMAGGLVLDEVVHKILRVVLTSAGAERGFLVLERGGRLLIEAQITIAPDTVRVGLRLPIEESDELPVTIVSYVARTGEAIVLGDAASDRRFAGDPYVEARRPRSVLCISLTHRGALRGILYLENSAAEGVFAESSAELLRLLSSHAAIAVENALLYEDMRAMTETLQRSNQELSSANERLRVELAERERAERERVELQDEVIRMQRALAPPDLPR